MLLGTIVLLLAIIGAARIAIVTWRAVRNAARATVARMRSALANRAPRARKVDPRDAAMMAVAAAMVALAQQMSAKKGTR